ncbi:Fc.00g081940.m01.CDS01 [Cosmosporella sp. VM-42]
MEKSKHQFSTTTTAGLQFYRESVHENEHVRSVLGATFDWCALGDYRRIQEDRGHIFQLRMGGAKADILVVQLWKDGCRGIYWRGSHHISPKALESPRAANRMWEAASARLERAGCQPVPLDFQTGGLVVLDARVAFETDHGSPVTCSFAPLYQLRNWRKLIPPKSEASDRLVEELQTEKMGVYFTLSED